MRTPQRLRATLRLATLSLALVAGTAACSADSAIAGPSIDKKDPRVLPSHEQLRQALIAVRREANGGLNLEMWGTLVDRTGAVVAVAYTGGLPDDQWPGSRVISAQKANTANAFSLRGLALSTANLYTATQPGGTLFGLQASNPVDPDAAYAGKYSDFGSAKDPLVGKRVGGINVFGGGFALYNSNGEIVGGLGVSGDLSCADHNIGWKLRDRLNLDYVPGGVAPGRSERESTDNIIHDIETVNGIPASQKSPSGFGHPVCTPEASRISAALPTTHALR